MGVTLRVLAPSITPRFRRALAQLGCELMTRSEGVSEGMLGPFTLRVVEAEAASRTAGERLLYTFSPALLRNPRGVGKLDEIEATLFQNLTRHVEQLRSHEDAMAMKDIPIMRQSYSEAMKDLMARIPLEEQLLMLPVEALRALSEAYLATLPDGTRAKILARRAG